jgi:bacterioferritin (cytochrome b1)
MTSKEIQKELVANMRQWQKIEDASVTSTSQIIKKTPNLLVRMIMEIIMRDSQMHYRVQELIANSIESKAVSLTPDELADIWKQVERHIDLEKKTLRLARKSIKSVKGQQGMIVQEYLLNYLLEDEKKHNDLLSRLNDIKRGVYRSV